MLTVSFAMTTVSEKETNPGSPREMLPGLLLYVKYGIT